MAKFLILLSCGLIYSTFSSSLPLVQFFDGFSVGYGLGEDCNTSLDGIDQKWNDFAGTQRDGSGAALTKLRDFTSYIAEAATTCNLLQVANLMDSAFTTNQLATILRLVASFQEVLDAWQVFVQGVLANDAPTAGEAFGTLVKKLVG